MIKDAEQYAVAQRHDEKTEKLRQEVSTILAEIDNLVPEVEAVVAGSDFGRDAVRKAEGAMEDARNMMQRGDHTALEEQLEVLKRTRRMFRGVVGKGN